MNLLRLCMLSLGLAVTIAAAEPPADGTVLQRTEVKPAAFETLQNMGRYATAEEYNAAAADQSFVLERVVYASEGLEVVAFLYRPAGRSGQHPAIVFNRGGYTAVETENMLRGMFHRLARAGFTVIAPMLRESAGAGGKDQVGGEDLQDLMNVAALAKNLGGIDTGNLFLYGHSRGGMMTYQAVRDGFPARAGATVGAFTDFQALIDAHPKIYGPLLPKIFPDFEKRSAEITRRRSAMSWPEKLDTPLLILHSTADPQVDAGHAIRLAARLQELKKPFQLHVFQAGDHILAARREERDRLVTEWFKAHLKQPASGN